jgi:N-acyl amino acid synthase of PEP-CTERM/exosortase system
MSHSSITNQFQEQFSLLIANTPELRAEVYKIRYQVYCDELGYEQLENFPDRMETDTYDRRSIHCLLKHRKTDLYAGCVRLILNEHLDEPFPFEMTCAGKLYPDTPITQVRRNQLAEVSRLAITAQFRKRQGESKTPYGVSDTSHISSDDRRGFPVIALSLYLAAAAIALELEFDLGLRYVCTMMEPRLSRHLRYFGINFRQIGEVVSHRGSRAPFDIDREMLSGGLDANFLSLLQFITATIKPGIPAAVDQLFLPDPIFK